MALTIDKFNSSLRLSSPPISAQVTSGIVVNPSLLEVGWILETALV